MMIAAALWCGGWWVASLPVMAAPQTVTPGAVWQDAEGHVIQAHAGGIIRVGKTFYWFGEDRAQGFPFQNVTCYASADLAHWTFKSDALTRRADGDLGPNRVVERPKVIYNRSTKTYVMYLHIDSPNYAEAKVGVATSKTVTGPYTYLGSFRPLGHESRDMTLFQDSDGAGYLVFEDRGAGGGIRIERLSPDYLKVESEVATVGRRGGYEAPAVVKIGATYFLLGSHLSGWNTNSNQYATASALSGPWSAFQDVAPPKTRTYDSQTAFILPVAGRRTTSYIYGGDRWEPNNLGDSRYIWMPLTVAGQTLTLSPDVPWTVDTVTGETRPQN